MPRKSDEVKAVHRELDGIKEDLIEEVKKMPILWDLAHKHYNYLNLKDNAWDCVKDYLEDHFGLEMLKKHSLDSREALKETWKKLRTQYAQNKRHRKGASGAGAEEVKPIRWRFFRQMCFLDRTIVAIPTINSMKFELTGAGDDNDDDLQQSPSEEVVSGNGCLSPLSKRRMQEDSHPGTGATSSVNVLSQEQQNKSSENLGSPARVVSPWSPSKQRTKKTQDTRKDNDRQAREEAFREAIQILKKPPESQNMTFCKYLATLLDKVHEEERERLQFEMIKCVNTVLEKQRQNENSDT